MVNLEEQVEEFTPRVARGMRALGKVTSEQFERIKNEILKKIRSIRENLTRISELLGRLDQIQTREIKIALKGMVSAEWIDRMKLYGNGKIGAHLALRDKSLPASILRKMSPAALKRLNNTNETIPLMTPNGVVINKTPAQMNHVELQRIVNPSTGKILLPDQQCLFVKKANLKATAKREFQDAEMFESLKRLDDEHVLICGNNNGRIKVALRTLKRQLQSAGLLDATAS